MHRYEQPESFVIWVQVMKREYAWEAFQRVSRLTSESVDLAQAVVGGEGGYFRVDAPPPNPGVDTRSPL